MADLPLTRTTTQVAALVERYGIEQMAISAECCKRYKEKHGIDIEKIQTQYQEKRASAVAEYYRKQGITEPAPVPEYVTKDIVMPRLPPMEKDLDQKILFERIGDRVAFLVAAYKVLRNPDDDPKCIGQLNNVRVNGDKATGQATQRIYNLRSTAGQPPQKGWQDIDGPFYFIKINGGWFIHHP